MEDFEKLWEIFSKFFEDLQRCVTREFWHSSCMHSFESNAWFIQYLFLFSNKTQSWIEHWKYSGKVSEIWPEKLGIMHMYKIVKYYEILWEMIVIETVTQL